MRGKQSDVWLSAGRDIWGPTSVGVVDIKIECVEIDLLFEY